MQVNKNIFFICMGWLLLISASFTWNYLDSCKGEKQLAFSIARSIFDQIVITRLWNAYHGGVYVPVTEETRPNPYLDLPMRDIDINDDLKLTIINPAFMTRQISEIASKEGGIQFHITSLKPIRPENGPNEIETLWLENFEKGKKEAGKFINVISGKHFFYMAPLRVQKQCLKCHKKQGYIIGDIIGGISVNIPFKAYKPLLSLLSWHILIGFIGLSGIIFYGRRLGDAYKTIKNQAVMDALTGIPNRRTFSETILREFKRSVREHEPLSIIMCDIDRFKEYNDTYGHVMGDKCLIDIAQKIRDTLQRPVDFCARYGGEEFVVILPNTNLEGALYVAEQIRLNVEAMKIRHTKSSDEKYVTISLGVASSEDFLLISHEELINKADIALYRAKKCGRNRVAFFDEPVDRD